MILLTYAGIAYSVPFSDVPASHWACQAVSEMADKGIVQGFPNETFKGNENLSRFQLAMIISRMLASIEQNGIDSVANNDLQAIEKLTVEFADELAVLGIKVSNLEEDLQVIKEDVSVLKKDVKSINDNIKNGNLDKVKLSGDILVRNYNFYYDKGSLEINGSGRFHRQRTSTIMRLQLDTDIDENISARVRWDLIGNNGTNEWSGRIINSGNIKIAYLKLKDMFNFGGDFLIGRDKFYHGHGFVVYDYMDMVAYKKKCGDVDIAINCFFEKQGIKNLYNIWNFNADYNYKGHALYFGFYCNNRAYDDYLIPFEDNRRELRYEFGSRGKLSRKNNNYTYDLGFVYSDIEDGIRPNFNAQGLLGHLAFTYDSKEQFKLKLSYTFADDESNSNIYVKNLNSYSMDKVTIFDDLYLDSLVANANTNRTFQNLRDYKLQIGFTPKNAQRHHLRLAYDYVENIYDGKENTFNILAGSPVMGFINDMRSHIFTLDYTYKFTNDTRFRFGYKNSRVNASNRPELWVNLYFTELFSRF